MVEPVPKKPHLQYDREKFDREQFEASFLKYINENKQSSIQREVEENFDIYVFHETSDKLGYGYCQKCTEKKKNNSKPANPGRSNQTF